MRVAAKVLALIAVAGAACRLLPSSLSALPFVPLVVAATPAYALLAAVALALTLVPLAWAGHHASRALVRLGTLAVIALELVWFAPCAVPAPRVAQAREDEAATTLTVMTCNVYKGAADPQAIVDAVREQDVDVLCLQETTVSFVESLQAAGLDELLPYSQRSSSDGVYGNGVWSTRPLEDVATDDIGSSASAMPAGTISVERADGSVARVRIVSVHTCSPGPGYWDLWRRSIEELGIVRERLATDSSVGYVLAGDFNATWDHASFREMLGEDASADSETGAALHDAAHECGQGLVTTWPQVAGLPSLAGIDHVVTSDGVVATSVRSLAIPGTDHKALIVTLSVR